MGTKTVPSIAGIHFDQNNSEIFYTATNSGTVAKWRRGVGTPIWTSDLSLTSGQYSQAIAVSHDGALLAVHENRDRIVILNAENGHRLAQTFRMGDAYPLPSRPLITSLAFSSDGSMLVAGDVNGFIAIWSLSSEQPLAVLGSASTPVRRVRFASDSRFVVASDAKDVVIWNIEEQRIAATLNDLNDGHYWFEDAYIPDYERYLVITSINDTLIYDLSAQKIVAAYKTNAAIAHDSGDHSRYGPLLTVTDDNLRSLYRFHKNPYVEVLDLESGEVNKTYRVRQTAGAFGFGPYFTHVALVPGICGNFIVGTERFALNIFRGALENHLELREYLLPCD